MPTKVDLTRIATYFLWYVMGSHFFVFFARKPTLSGRAPSEAQEEVEKGGTLLFPSTTMIRIELSHAD